MSNFRNLRVYHAAIAQLRDLGPLTTSVHFGDLANQLRRAAISVPSNIAEGSGRSTNTEFVRFLTIARASNDEIAAQLDILVALGGTDASAALAANAAISRQLSGLIRYLRGSG